MDGSSFSSLAFIEGLNPGRFEPLGRYLPPIADEVISTWLKKNIAPGAWILDPFGASPKIALEAALNGYRVLVTANNPITRFLLETMADPPSVDELKNALAELAASYIGSERVEPYIRSLYNTTCARCGQVISADAYVWEHGNPAPSFCVYTCPSCGYRAEQPCTTADIELAGRFSGSGLHKARALERVVSALDPDRIHVEQALSVYIPRALFALVTIINKIEGLEISSLDRKCLLALLLYAFDQATAMWRTPNQKERRRQLTVPHHFRENNIWFALEDGIQRWSTCYPPASVRKIPVTTWPLLPPAAGGICVFEGRFITLADTVKDIDISAVGTAIPRPNQAFWTLSALWAGWLWGREAVGTFKSVLRRQRYDWAWHTHALSSVFKQLAITLRPSAPIFALLSEAEPGFITATLVAACLSGCRLEGLAVSPDEAQAQLLWRSEIDRGSAAFNILSSQVAVQYTRDYLRQNGEPANYLTALSAALLGKLDQPDSRQAEVQKKKSGESGQSAIASQAEPSPSQAYTTTFTMLRESLSYRSGFLRFNLPEISSLEGAAKSRDLQNTLFSLDGLSASGQDEESDLLESPAQPTEPGGDKERSIRSPEVSESTFLWLRDASASGQVPITDRYEEYLVTFLVNHPGCTVQEISEALCSEFKGLFTPPMEFIRLCLDSYAMPESHNTDHCFIRPEDLPSDRQVDLDQAYLAIHRMGERLGFSHDEVPLARSNRAITWRDSNGDLKYRFVPLVTAAFSRIVLFGEQHHERGLIILPGSRANLLFYKLRRDPRLARSFSPDQGSWSFLKFRHLRTLAESPVLDRSNFDQLLSLDPITYTTPQLWLI